MVGALLGLAGAGCGDDSKPKSSGCGNFNSKYDERQGQFSQAGLNYGQGISYLQSSVECPSRCELVGESKDKYCCWCPD